MSPGWEVVGLAPDWCCMVLLLMESLKETSLVIRTTSSFLCLGGKASPIVADKNSVRKW